MQAGIRKERGTQNIIANICCILECSKEFPKKVSLCFMDYSKAFDCGSWKAMGCSERNGCDSALIFLMLNLYWGQAGNHH